MTADDVVKIVAPVIAWAVACINVVVLPFTKRRETLDKDYRSSGRIAAALSAIESERLVEALGGIFEDVLDKKEDKRRRADIRELLQSADFLPDFKKAESAYRDMGEIETTYRELQTASDLWKPGALHCLLTVLIPVACLDLGKSVGWEWMTPGRLLTVVGIAWALTLLLVVRRWLQYHSLMVRFLAQLEAATDGGDGS